MNTGISHRTVLRALALSALAFVFILGNAQAAKVKYKEADVANGGALKGKITLSGSYKNKKIKVSKDQKVCGEHVMDESLTVHNGGGIVNAVVEIQGIKSGKKWNLPAKFSYGQKKCAFSPHVLLVRPRAAGAVDNSDGVKHNVHTISKGVFNVNKTVGPGKKLKVKKNKIKKSGTVKVVCDLHNWMNGWWIVPASPYVALSGSGGGFEIKNIPPGKYKVRVWQEKLGEKVETVEIKAGATATMNVSLKMK